MFRVHLETCHTLPRSEATEAAVLHACFLRWLRGKNFHTLTRSFSGGSVGDANIFWRARPARRTSIESWLVGPDLAGLTSHIVSCSELRKVFGTSAETMTADMVEPKLVFLSSGWGGCHLAQRRNIPGRAALEVVANSFHRVAAFIASLGEPETLLSRSRPVGRTKHAMWAGDPGMFHLVLL